jgi:hypothetical protein
MAAVARPRNNLQEQLNWFHTERPQIPSRGPAIDYTRISIEQVIAAQTQATQLIRNPWNIQSASEPLGEAQMPNPAAGRSFSLAVPQRNIQNSRDSIARSKSANEDFQGTAKRSVGTAKAQTFSRIFFLNCADI